MRGTAWLTTLAWLLLSAAAPAAAEQPDAVVEGVIRDPDGCVLPGASVELENLAAAQTRRTVCDAEGRFRFSALAGGVYALRARLEGFEQTVVDKLLVKRGQTQTVDLELELEPAVGCPLVEPYPPIVDPEQSPAETTIREEHLERLPLRRGVLSTLMLAPGVVD